MPACPKRLLKRLLEDYGEKKRDIKKRLGEFKSMWNQSDRRIFSELCFCICTPQSRAVVCDRAITALEKSGKLFSGGIKDVREGLVGVRFPNNKARFIVHTRKQMTVGGKIQIKERILPSDIRGTRDWLVSNVMGIGYKEASHFLRNIGLGEELAILDVHILRNMIRFGVIEDVPKSLTKNRYMSIEDRLKTFSGDVKIPMGELDMLIWSSQTGVIFK